MRDWGVMNFRKIKIGLGVVVVAGAMMGVAAPAQALASCPQYACVWRDANFVTNGSSSGYRGWNQYIYDFAQWNYNGTSINADNSATSVTNLGNWDPINLYQHRNKGGLVATLAPRSEDANLGASPGITNFNDILGSAYFQSEL